jgi:class 3 adenylate cyclase
VIACSHCGRENPDDARFCNSCGTVLAAATRAREERKVVTAVFVDLVGSTARAEQLDPEDVRALLRRYHETLRRDLERYGGTVEKFIGDAVVAVYGAPAAHEDDPERAVRAVLAIDSGRFGDAAEVLREIGEPQLEAEARVLEARELRATGDDTGAEHRVARARELLDGLGATARLRELDALP